MIQGLRHRPRLAGAAGLVAAVVLLVAVHVRIGVPWSPLHSHDTRLYYLPTLEVLNNPQAAPLSWFGAPFFRSVQRRDLRSEPPVPAFRAPSAADAKPVFVALLRAWALAVRLFRPGPVDGPLVVSTFVLVSSLAAFGALVLLGRRLGRAEAGVVAGLLALGGPWGIFTCYFNTYTAASLALYVLAYSLCLAGTWRSAVAAGLLAVGVALSNQSLLALLPSLPLGIFLGGPWAERRRRMFAATVFCATFAGAFLFLEAEAVVAERIVGDSDAIATSEPSAPDALRTIGPLRTLRQYLALSGHDRADTFAAYSRSLFPGLCRYDSTTGIALGLLATVALAVCCAADRFAARGRATEVGGDVEDGPALRWRALGPVLLAALPGLVGLIVIDLKSGPKFARSYFLCLPFLLLAGTIAAQAVLRSLGRQVAIPAAIGASLLVAGEAGFRLVELDAALHGVAHTVCRLRAEGREVVVVQQDGYAPFFGAAEDPPLPIVSFAERGTIGDVYVLVGPDVRSALEFTDRPPGFAALLGRRAHEAELVERLPFFAHLPYLTYEDPHATYAARVEHAIRLDDFRRPAGQASLYRLPLRERGASVSAQPVGAPHAD